MVAYRHTMEHGGTSNTAGYKFANIVSVDSDIALIGVECTVSGNGAASVYVWNTSTQALLSSASGTSVNGRLNLSTPYTLVAGTQYTIGFYSANGQNYLSSVAKPHTHAEELNGGPTLTVHGAIYTNGDSSAYPTTTYAGEWEHIYYSENPNNPPTISPVTADGTTFNTEEPTVQVTVSDPDAGQTLFPNFQVASDVGFTTNLQSGGGLGVSTPASNVLRGWIPAPLADGVWYWRAQVSDGIDTSAWTATRSFTVATRPTAPTNLNVSPDPVPYGDNAQVTWTHNDPNGSPQAQYQIRWREAD